VRLRQRLLAYFALVAVASCALTVGVAVVLVRHQIGGKRMSALEAQADAVAAAGGASGAQLPGQHVYLVGGKRPRRARPALASLVLAAVPAGDGQGTVRVAGRSLLYAARQTASGRVVLVRSAALRFGEWRPFLWALALAGLGGVLLAALLSWLLARRLADPIGRLAHASRRLARGEAGVTVPLAGRDELADLGGAFNAMSEDLQVAQEAHRHFLESVSHELRTPLTSIRGYAEALADDAVSPVEGGRVIAAESERLERLVADLLELARFGRAGFSVRSEPLDLAALAEQATERHRPRARVLGVSLTTTRSGEPSALGDADRVLQAVSNLVENALRITPAGGSITVAAGPGELTVRDTGPGLEPDDIRHAFERFYLYDRYRSERPVGSGLGLAIVAELAVAMGGSVEAGNAPGGGAQFTLRLPQAPRLEVNVRTLQVALDQTQEGGGRRTARPAVHEAGAGDHGGRP
jgi:two-component system sensor histidine kinase BaeS